MASYVKGSENVRASVTTGLAGHPAFPARRRLRLMPALPGRHIQSARRHATVLRLAVRSDDFAVAQFDAVCRASFTKVLPYAFCLGHRARQRRSLPYGIGRPALAIIPTCPKQSASIVIRLAQATMAIRPSVGPD